MSNNYSRRQIIKEAGGFVAGAASVGIVNYLTNDSRIIKPAQAQTVISIRRWAELRADQVRRYAESSKAHGYDIGFPGPNFELPSGEPASSWDMSDAARRLGEGYSDALRRVAEGRLPTVLLVVASRFQNDISYITQRGALIDLRGVGSNQVERRLREALRDVGFRFQETPGVSGDPSSYLQLYTSLPGPPAGDDILRLAEGFGDCCRRISEGWKDALLRIKEAGLLNSQLTSQPMVSVEMIIRNLIHVIS